MTPAYLSSLAGRHMKARKVFTIADVPGAKAPVSDFSSRYSGAKERQGYSSQKQGAVQ
jgi:hypothetical protein